MDPEPISSERIELVRTLSGHTGAVTRLCWLERGRFLASVAGDNTICIWSIPDGHLERTLARQVGTIFALSYSRSLGQLAFAGSDGVVRTWNPVLDAEAREVADIKDAVLSVDWAPDGSQIACGCSDSAVRIVETHTSQKVSLVGHSGAVFSVNWSPDGAILCSGSADGSLRLWATADHQLVGILNGHSGPVFAVCWSPTGKLLASGSQDGTVRIWDAATRTAVGVLEKHTDAVTGVSFSGDGHFIASKSADGTVIIWDASSMVPVLCIDEPSGGSFFAQLQFDSAGDLLATLGERDTILRIWQVPGHLSVNPSVERSTRYVNAKIVLLGDSGVGKSGLAAALIGEPFAPTASTHGRKVYHFDRKVATDIDGSTIVREISLWDLAGQPGYRIIHQLSIGDSSHAVVLFDSRSELDPFAGVRHWVRAVQREQEATGRHISMTLVAARTDRGGVAVSQHRLQQTLEALGFDAYFETSAMTGIGIQQLREHLRSSIRWDSLPWVMSPALFTEIKEFLLTSRNAGLILSNAQELFKNFTDLSRDAVVEREDLHAAFSACIRTLETVGLAKTLRFGDLVLLRPEILDDYASAMVNAARNEPDGLGSIPEGDLISGQVRVSSAEQISDPNIHRLIVIATIEELLRHELVTREVTDGGTYIVFPSQFTRELPPTSALRGRRRVLEFTGPIANIYSTLVVRLAHSSSFVKSEFWRNAAVFEAADGARCGLQLRSAGEGDGEITLFFEGPDEVTRRRFEDYVHIHLMRRALPGSLKNTQVVCCSECDAEISSTHIGARRLRGFNWIVCPVCESRIQLEDEAQEVDALASHMRDMDKSADARREKEAARATISGKLETRDYDVFLCYSSRDRVAVHQIASKLREHGVLPWLDDDQVRPGLPWHESLTQKIRQIKSIAVFVSGGGPGPWHQQEMRALLSQAVQQQLPVIPVLLPGADDVAVNAMPPFLKGISWVDFSDSIQSPALELFADAVRREAHASPRE